MRNGIELRAAAPAGCEEILTDEALDFVASLHRKWSPRRDELLVRRTNRQGEIDNGILPDFLACTKEIRTSDWKVAPAPKDLNDRRVEITGPVEAKMMINALTSGAQVFMADFEDALSPTWANVIEGQKNVRAAVRRTLSFTSPEGKRYELRDPLATLLIRPRGWHLTEKHVEIDGRAVSASLFDFGLFFFHNAKELVARGSGPYLYLPKLESHLEARLWNDVFIQAQEMLNLPRGTIRATVLIETIFAAFEMEEILYELREHASGLNAGRWDYIFSIIKKFRSHPDFILPDRAMITMTVPFMRAYTELLVRTCHRRGAHALGGMAAFIPNRKDAEVTRVALEKVRDDKRREAADGFDGTWVAHPDLVPVAREMFGAVLGANPNQKDRLREDVEARTAPLLSMRVPGGKVTSEGIRTNINVALQYIERWLLGVGAAAIHNLMEDAATAEISRAQLWQWIHHGVKVDGKEPLTSNIYRKFRDEEIARLDPERTGRFDLATKLLNELAVNEKFPEFLTLKAYSHL